MNSVEVSVVIGFRDWGAERIQRSAQSIITAFDGISGEVVISDYGSEDPGPARRVAEHLGAKYVYTPGDPVWSRSRALNAGFAVAEGRLLISTDADMLFSPSSIRRIVETANGAGRCALFLQCRDLPEAMGDEYFADAPTINWNLLEAEGRLRPRWGMGGMMAISSEGFATIRGFDERLHTYGGEDLDFAQRARRAGYRTIWVEDPDVRMYHMWHAPTLRTVEQTEEGKSAVAFNRSVVYEDKTFVRNITNWAYFPAEGDPLVSIVYATRNRADLLEESIYSALTQSVQDFEIIIVDDGSDDDSTANMVKSIGDSRIRYFRQEKSGISAARNLALDHSRGYYTAVMDDDDLMPPKRLQWQLESLTPEFVGSCGSFVNFDDSTGEREVIISKNPGLAQSVEKGGAPGHGTWFLRTDVMRAIRYDEKITSGVDNNFFLRLLRAGYRVTHCGKPVLLRRMHRKQVTAVDAVRQGDAARQALRFLQFGHTKWHADRLAEDAKKNAWPKTDTREEMLRSVEAYLPDHLVRRNASVILRHQGDPLPEFDGNCITQTLRRGEDVIWSRVTVKDASYRDLCRLTALAGDVEASIEGEEVEDPYTNFSWVSPLLAEYLDTNFDSSMVLVARGASQPEFEADSVVYEMEVDGSVETVSVVEARTDATARVKPWIAVGATAEEYWA